MSVLNDLMSDAGLGQLESKVDPAAGQNMIQRYRPQMTGDYNKNPMFQEKTDRTQDIEALLEHGDFASGMEKSDVLGIRVPSARVLHAGQETGQLNSQSLSKSGMSFGKPHKVTRKDLYKLRGNAAKSVSLMRKMGFNGTIHGFGSRPNVTDHDDGNAADYMVGKNRKLGAQIARYSIANRKALGVKYVIYRQRIASASTGWKWKKMEDRGSPTANHMDHTHVSYF